MRTWLFAPANDRRKLESALRSPAALVVADLEDAVAPARKETALQAACEFVAADGDDERRVVRVNDPASELGARELQVLTEATAAPIVMVPKATRATVLQAAASGARTVPLVESARGIAEMEAIAAVDGVVAVALGTADLRAELSLGRSPEELELLYERSRLVLACALTGVPAIDGVHLELDDASGLHRAALRSRGLGFAGMLCIHPLQLAIVAAAFAPTPGELKHARRVVDAYERALAGGRGAVAEDGEMVDLATVRRARQLLAEGGDVAV